MSPPEKRKKNDIAFLYYFSDFIAPAGQFSSQAPQSTQSSGLTICALSSFNSITSAGQLSTHVPQPVHASSSILGGILFYLFLVCLSFVL
jgi:hypothetical protein